MGTRAPARIDGIAMLAPGARLGRVADHAPRILRGAVALRSHAHSRGGVGLPGRVLLSGWRAREYRGAMARSRAGQQLAQALLHAPPLRRHDGKARRVARTPV